MTSRVTVCLVVEKRVKHWPLQSNLNERYEIKTHQEMGITCLGCILTCLRQFSACISTNLCLIENVEAIEYPLGILVINPYSLAYDSQSHFLFCSGKKNQVHRARGLYPPCGGCVPVRSIRGCPEFVVLLFFFLIWWERKGEGVPDTFIPLTKELMSTFAF